MNMHVNRPKTGNGTIPSGLLAQEQARQDALKTLSTLRREARDEIARLIELLDATDVYVTGELEDDGDQGDASYPEHPASRRIWISSASGCRCVSGIQRQ